MPAKVKPPPISKEQKILLENINFLCDRYGITRTEFCDVIGLKSNAYYDRKKDPGKFTVTQLQRFASKVNIPIGNLFVELKLGA